MKSKWYGEPPKSCDICGKKIEGVFIDGRIRTGRWAIMCEVCHRSLGVGLGIGKGQKYKVKVVKEGEKEWIKVKRCK